MKKTTLVVLLLIATHSISAQQAIPASGGGATGSGSVSYTVGQMVYTTNTGSNGSVAQGVQQGIELFTLSNPELTTVNLTAVTYPNPTSDYIVLQITDTALEGLSYQLFDVQGKAIAKGPVTKEDTQINMQQLALGMYLLKVTQNNQELKTFKIIKK